MSKCKDNLPCVGCKCDCSESNTGHKCNECPNKCEGKHERKQKI